MRKYIAMLTPLTPFGAAFYANGTSSLYADDGLGNRTETVFQDRTHSVRISDSWTKADGSSGSDIYNSDGSSSGSTYLGDGSYSTYANDGYGNVHTVHYDAQGAITDEVWNFANGNYSVVNNDMQGNVTTTIYNSQGTRLSDSWRKADGSYGNDSYAADGSSSGTVHRADGSYDRNALFILQGVRPWLFKYDAANDAKGRLAA